MHPALEVIGLVLLIEEAREQDTALLLATHDPDRAARHGFSLLPLATEVGAGGGRSRLSRQAIALA